MIPKNKVTVYELHDDIISVNFSGRKEENVARQKTLEVSDEVFKVLQGKDWAETARDLLNN